MAAAYPYNRGLVPNSLNYYMNGHAIGGSPDLYLTPTVPDYAVGSKLECSDGRVFRYGYFIAAVAAARAAAVDISEANEVAALDNICTAAAIGATTITLTSASINQTANAHAGSFLHIEAGPGAGYIYPILGNDVGASNVVVMYLAVGLQVALTTASDIQLVGCPYYNLIIGSTTDTGIKGVTVGAPSAADFGWIQTKGFASVLCDATGSGAVVGTLATLSDSVDGAASAGGGGSTSVVELILEPFIGVFVTTGTDTDTVVVDLNLE